MNTFKQRKPQTEQQILARNEGRSLGSLGMMLAQIDALYRMNTITLVEKQELSAPIFYLKFRVLQSMKDRMKAAGTWKEVNYDF